MIRRFLLFCFFVVVLSFSRVARAAILDQSFVGDTTLSAEINEGVFCNCTDIYSRYYG
jgi:hypothetical protein